jgi:chromate transporter
MPRLSGALSFITASVVGVIAHLSLWFAAHVIFAQVGRIDLGPIHAMWPQITSLRPLPTILALGSAYLLLRLQWSLPLVLALAALASALGGML